jgi:DNA adenine methylase
MKPFLKWPGGKRWLVEAVGRFAPPNVNTYYEPFFGGGAMFFGLNPLKAVVSDTNAELIETYQALRDEPEEIRIKLARYAAKHCESYYYEVRGRQEEDRLQRAARFIYLNRTCFNGLYRVNLKGEFNVPKGTKDTILFADEDFALIAKRLEDVEIRVSDFEQSLGAARKGDLVYLDPPYTVKHNLNGFVKYNEKIFSWADQERLERVARLAVGRGAKVIVSNALHESIVELYSDHVWELHAVDRHSTLASHRSARGLTSEALIVSKG